MKLLAWLFGGLLGLVLLLLVSQWIASESGEVVVLTTSDIAGEPHETRLWVVDYQGAPWLRAGAAVQGWYQRLLAKPEVELTRNGTTTAYTAVPEIAKRKVINDLMLAKYGWADRYIGLFFGRGNSVPIRLELRERAP